MGAFVVTYPVVDGAVIRSVAALGGASDHLGRVLMAIGALRCTCANLSPMRSSLLLI